MLFNLNPSSAINVAEDIRGPKTTATVNIAATASVALAANNSRAVYGIYNAGNTPVFVREGAVVTSTLYDFIIPPGFYWKEDFSNSPRYLGAVSAVTASGTTSLQVSEAVLLP